MIATSVLNHPRKIVIDHTLATCPKCKMAAEIYFLDNTAPHSFSILSTSLYCVNSYFPVSHDFYEITLYISDQKNNGTIVFWKTFFGHEITQFRNTVRTTYIFMFSDCSDFPIVIFGIRVVFGVVWKSFKSLLLRCSIL